MKNQYVKFEYANHTYTATVNDIQSIIDYATNDKRPCTVTTADRACYDALYELGMPNMVLATLEAKEPKKMKTETILAVIAVIKERTKENDHNQALILASTLLDNIKVQNESTRTKVLKHVREIHNLTKYMPSGLIEVREMYRKGIMDGLEFQLDAKIFAELKASI